MPTGPDDADRHLAMRDSGMHACSEPTALSFSLHSISLYIRM
jgi:hypothetical protein